MIECTAGQRKHLIAEEYLRQPFSVGPGVFLILVARARATVWKVRRSPDGAVIVRPGAASRDVRQSLLIPHLGH